MYGTGQINNSTSQMTAFLLRLLIASCVPYARPEFEQELPNPIYSTTREESIISKQAQPRLISRVFVQSYNSVI
ncbi:hypothetical protein BofuT4_uP120410.1 [Botrytis cinerea T4]|uniref:Uncharacterized protein n=1 Tax=Botryotinia fuckeliana (strain T4) TaxID=999810 RepID=G2XXZ8_BOTF4|nr:hypothetical protein BofuT4_uP120410.1 [Botrytis cinerea T4]